MAVENSKVCFTGRCHRLPICFLTSYLTIRNKNKRTLIVRRAGLSSFTGRCQSTDKDHESEQIMATRFVLGKSFNCFNCRCSKLKLVFFRILTVELNIWVFVFESCYAFYWKYKYVSLCSKLKLFNKLASLLIGHQANMSWAARGLLALPEPRFVTG